jgi:hypothetical protein
VSEGSGRAMRRTSRRRKQVGRHGARAAQQAAAATLRPPPPNPPLQCQFDYNADQDNIKGISEAVHKNERSFVTPSTGRQ